MENERDITEAVVTEALQYMLTGEWNVEDTALEGAGAGLEVRSFEEAGVMTRDEGLVVTLPGGAEFQITVKQSRRGRY